MNYNKLLQIAKQFEKTAGDVVDLFPKYHEKYDEYEPMQLDSDVDLMPGSDKDIEWCAKCGVSPEKSNTKLEAFFSNTGKPLNSISLCKDCLDELLSLNDLKRT